MNPWQKGKSFIASIFLAIFLIILALGGGAALGKFYIYLIIGYGDSGKPKTAPVMQNEKDKTLDLTPLPLYYVQVGGLGSGIENSTALSKLEEAGISAFQTAGDSQKIMAGIFGQREKAVNFSVYLEELGFGSRVVTTILNDKVTLGDRSLEPLLSAYTGWFQKTTERWDTFEAVYNENFEDVFAKSTQDYNDITEIQKKIKVTEISTKNKLITLKSSSAAYMMTLQILARDWSRDNYNHALEALMEVVEDYKNLVNQGSGGKKV